MQVNIKVSVSIKRKEIEEPSVVIMRSLPLHITIILTLPTSYESYALMKINSPDVPDWAMKPPFIRQALLTYPEVEGTAFLTAPGVLVEGPGRPDIKTLPPWLQVRDTSMDNLELKLIELKEAMKRSYLIPDQSVEVLSAVQVASSGNISTMIGVSDFIISLLDVMEMGKDTLIAACFHFASCLKVREQGSLNFNNGNHEEDVDQKENWKHLMIDEISFLLPLAGSGIEQFGTIVPKIALNAARIKRTEVIASRLGINGSSEAENLRKLLLSVTADWRALAIRANASLFRIRGLIRNESVECIEFGKDCSVNVKREAKDALNVYAPIAHRLGMYRLKSELEDCAFQLLYRRQHDLVMDLYRRAGIEHARYLPLRNRLNLNTSECNSVSEGMQAVISEVTKRLKRGLFEDDLFMNSIEKISFTARIKAPFSFWRKLLKQRSQLSSKNENPKMHKQTLFDVNDVCAIRVILQAKKFTVNEPAEVTRKRERALCYYVLQSCSRRWPTHDDYKTKDYIKTPKQNGYQSLHYSSRMRWHGDEFPFEVQVRSYEMHKVAEFGLAAHWNYKENAELENESPKKVDDAYVVMSSAFRERPEEFIAFESAHDLQNREPESFKSSVERQSRMDRAKARRQHMTPYLQALFAERTTLQNQKIFVFMYSHNSSKQLGTILTLPAGACILDALNEGSVEFGSTEMTRRGVNVFCNGQEARLTESLNNGDVIHVPLKTKSIICKEEHLVTCT